MVCAFVSKQCIFEDIELSKIKGGFFQQSVAHSIAARRDFDCPSFCEEIFLHDEEEHECEQRVVDSIVEHRSRERSNPPVGCLEGFIKRRVEVLHAERLQ